MTLKQKLPFWGIKSSPEDNGRAERFARILKENLRWVRIFLIVEELRHGQPRFRCAMNNFKPGPSPPDFTPICGQLIGVIGDRYS
jgi:hypothetical protein